MDYEKLYDQLMELHQEIHEKVELEFPFSSVREVQALGAVYTLIDYLANRIAAIGETPEGEEE